MTAEIALVLLILTAAIILFVTEKLRVDVVSLLVLGALVVAGLVTPEQAVSGFSNPAVITVWAVFILSGGLAQTGVANKIGKQVLRLAGDGEVRLLVVIMVTAGLMSAFMNNIGVAALMLPVVLDIGRQTGRAPSKLLLPLVFGALLGGMLTLIGTPPNILVSDALRDAGLRPFAFFDFTLAGALILLAGVLFMVLIGRHLLPNRDPVQSMAQSTAAGRNGDPELYGLNEVLAEIKLPPGSGLEGKTLAESRIGRALGLNILAVVRNGKRQLSPTPETVLQPGDRLLALGRLERLGQLSQQPNLAISGRQVSMRELISGPIGLAEFQIAPGSAYEGRSLSHLDLRRQLGVNVLAIRRNGETSRDDLPGKILKAGDWLLVQGEQSVLDLLKHLPEYRQPDAATLEALDLPIRLMVVTLPEGSGLAGKTLAESHLGQTFGLAAVGIMRGDKEHILPDPDTTLAVGDELIVEGHPRDLDIVRHLQELIVNRSPEVDIAELTSGPVALVEAMLSPYTTLVNKTLAEMNFRERFGLNVLAIWRGGRAYRSNLGERAIRLGDALLLYGPQSRIRMLGREPDFLVLSEEAQEPLRLNKAPVAALLMAAVVITVLAGWLPIAIAAVIGATLMVIAGCLDMEEAYRFIEWKAVFLIAGMLPLGIAMDETGAAAFIADGMMGLIGSAGPRVVMAGLFLLAMVATLFMPNPVVAVLMAPIALNTAAELQISPFAFMMAIAFGASASFLSPVGHPANVLVMGPGGYRFTDYLKVGVPLAVVLLLVVVFAVPIFWPFAAG